MATDGKLKKLAEERKKSNPFGKIDELEKELNLDETSEENAEDNVDGPIVVDNSPLLSGEDSDVRRAIIEKQRLDNQQPL